MGFSFGSQDSKSLEHPVEMIDENGVKMGGWVENTPMIFLGIFHEVIHPSFMGIPMNHQQLGFHQGMYGDVWVIHGDLNMAV